MNQDEFKGSVEITHYNAENYIRKALDSLVRQTINQDDFEFVQDRSGHDLRYAIDATKMREELGWEPKYTDFATGLADTIKWYEDNQSWWQAEKSEVEDKYAQNNQ